MENRNTIQDSNRGNQQCQVNRELELERKLMRESTRLDGANTYKMGYEQSIKVYLKQDEMYKKWKLLKGIREAREKINENDKKDIREQISKNENKKQKTQKRIERNRTRIREIEKI